jgi:two-component system NtrC family sensor kinase
LTRQLLSFSRRQALRPERIALQQWLPATEDLIRSTLGRSVELSVDVARDVLPIDVDTAELELALINTALNAQHAMSSGGVLRIAARNVAKAPGGNSPMVLISIEDNGSGIAPELLGRVFEPFFTTKAAGKGTGLGLSQVYGLCAQAGGQAVVDSSVGRGTTIGLYFPPATESVVEAGAPLETAPNTLDGHVLLVEDNDDVATATESLLIAAGLRVTRVPSADAAIATLAANDSRLDVVLSDISMPGSMDGIELAFQLKRDHPRLPVLLTTGYAERIGDAIAGGFRVLAKPAAADELLGELSALLPVRA